MRYTSLNVGLALSILIGGAVTLRAEDPPAQIQKPIPVQPIPVPPVPAALVPNQGPSPKIVFETPVFDFGRARAGDPVKHTFVFTNTGDALLEVTGVVPGCGCTTAGEWT